MRITCSTAAGSRAALVTAATCPSAIASFVLLETCSDRSACSRTRLSDRSRSRQILQLGPPTCSSFCWLSSCCSSSSDRAVSCCSSFCSDFVVAAARSLASRSSASFASTSFSSETTLSCGQSQPFMTVVMASGGETCDGGY